MNINSQSATSGRMLTEDGGYINVADVLGGTPTGQNANINHYAPLSGRMIKEDGTVVNIAERIGTGGGSGGGSVAIDPTLSVSGAAADAKATGDMFLSMLDGASARQHKAIMRAWFIHRGADGSSPAELTALCDEWYTITRTGWDGSVEFYQPDVSAVSTGVRRGDNAGMVCVPSTDTETNRDDFAGLPLFACVDCNWIVDADTLEPVITAIDGITSNFVRDDPGTYVGVLQMSGYHWQAEDEYTYTHGYCDNLKPYANIEPVPESVRVDGTVRPWVVHSKYMSKTADGKMTSCAGLIPTAQMSHNTLHTLSAKNGAQYSGGTSADDAWLKLMAYIKYASLTLDGILQGCCNNNYQYPVAASEIGVKRVLLTSSNASNFEVGMSVLIGNYAGSKDRGQAAMYSITSSSGAIITAKETVSINGMEYTALYVDTESAFDTVANGADTSGTTYITSWHWRSGACDSVIGNDGSPVSCTSGKYPAKLQGIEYAVGGYEVYADAILNLYQDGDAYYYEPYIVRRSSQQATSVTSNYKASGVKCTQPASNGWQYIKRAGCANGVCFPILVGGSSSTYTRDAFYMNASTAGTREWLAFGILNNGVGNAGLSSLSGTYALSSANWNLLARLSPNGNRGEWAA